MTATEKKQQLVEQSHLLSKQDMAIRIELDSIGQEARALQAKEQEALKRLQKNQADREQCFREIELLDSIAQQ